jgi:DNA-binding NarL/FixJ family response regulator
MQPQPNPINVVIADDHPIVRAGIRFLLESLRHVHVIAEVSDGAELLELLASVRPDVVITDISMPGMDGLTALKEIRERHPSLRVMVLSMHHSAEMAKRAVAAGAAAYLHKDASHFELASAIDSVMTTGSYVSVAVARELMAPSEPELESMLTPRQIEILKLLATGKSAKEIGFALGISSKTVDVHRSRIKERLGLRDLAGLVAYAIRHRLI